MATTTRAKFRCYRKDVINPDTDYAQTRVALGPVHSPNDPNSENHRFWKSSPSGLLELYINNPAGAAVFEENTEFYVDFTKAE